MYSATIIAIIGRNDKGIRLNQKVSPSGGYGMLTVTTTVDGVEITSVSMTLPNAGRIRGETYCERLHDVEWDESEAIYGRTRQVSALSHTDDSARDCVA